MPQKIKPKMVPGEMTGKMYREQEMRQRQNAMTRELEAMRKARGGVNITEMEEEETPGTKKVVGVVMTEKPKFNKLMKEKLLKMMAERKKLK
jgi:hypothetical protein